MALNIKKLHTPPHPDVTSVKIATKVRGATLEDSSRGDYASKSFNKNDSKHKVSVEAKEIVPPIKKLDLI